MREKSLKFLVNIFLLPLIIELSGCMNINHRLPMLSYSPYPQQYYSQESYSQPIQTQTYQTVQPIQIRQVQQNTTQTTQPSIKVQPTKTIQPQQKVSQAPQVPQVPQPSYKQPIVYNQQIQKNIETPTKPQVSKPTPIQPKINEEEILLEEVIYIPSALQSTPVDEIEILSEAPKELIAQEQEKEEKKIEQEAQQKQFIEKQETKPEIIPEVKQITKTEITNKVQKEEKPQLKIVIPQSEPTPIIQPVKKETKPKKVKVYKGDTLYSIAKKYNIKVYELAEYNKLEAPFTLKLGQTLELPSEEKKENKKEEPIIMNNLDEEKTFIEEPKKDFVIVKKGDTIYSIAKQNNVPLKDVILRNKLQAPYTLKIGDTIYIPNSAFHIVKAKETVYSISRHYNVNLNSLVKLNKIKEPYILVIGQKLLLPATNIDIEQKQIKYIVKDKDSSKLVKTSTQEKSKEISQIKVAKKEKIVAKPTTIPTKLTPEIQIQQKEKIEKIITKPAPLTSHRFMWPLKGKVISEYGIKNNGKRNDGINISARLGTSVVAAENGIVAYAGNELKGLGNLIIIKHAKDYMTIYAHNDTILVKKGDIIKRGDKIATVGKTGRVSIPQLHFEIRNKTKSLNPQDILERR